jgi:methyl-accepting chemotaxis protein
MISWFNNLSLRIKMSLGPIFLVVALIGLAIYSLQLIEAFKGAALLAALDDQVSGIHARLYQLTSVGSNDSNAAKVKELGDALRKDVGNIEGSFARVAANVGTDPARRELRDGMAKALKDYVSAGGQVVDMSSDASYALIFMNTAQDAFDSFADLHKKLAEQTTATAQRARIIFIVATSLVTLIATGATLLLGTLISQPVIAMAQAMRRLAGGELTIETPFGGRRDEIGAIAASLRVFKETAVAAEKLTAERERQRKLHEQRATRLADLTRQFDRAVTGVLETVGAAATELQATASSMAATAEQTSRQSAAAMDAAEEAAVNVHTVAAATEELAASVEEIGRQVALSTRVAGKAVGEAAKTHRTVQGLSEASKKIGAVIALINSIASQTNLLALNATIEAARAGDAGRGFAVVASEVKSLAQQTASATEEIAAQVNDMQEATGQAVGAIDGIGVTINDISKFAATIAAAIEQQTAATAEISRNVQQAASGTSAVSANIGGVSETAERTGGAAAQVLRAATQLSEQAGALRQQVDRFLSDVKAA